jgi:hypothetical protein
VGDDYVCAGLSSPEEVQRYLVPRVAATLAPSLARVTAVPACGWRGRAADHGVLWA